MLPITKIPLELSLTVLRIVSCLGTEFNWSGSFAPGFNLSLIRAIFKSTFASLLPSLKIITENNDSNNQNDSQKNENDDISMTSSIESTSIIYKI